MRLINEYLLSKTNNKIKFEFLPTDEIIVFTCLKKINSMWEDEETIDKAKYLDESIIILVKSKGSKLGKTYGDHLKNIMFTIDNVSEPYKIKNFKEGEYVINLEYIEEDKLFRFIKQSFKTVRAPDYVHRNYKTWTYYVIDEKTEKTKCCNLNYSSIDRWGGSENFSTHTFKLKASEIENNKLYLKVENLDGVCPLFYITADKSDNKYKYMI